MFMNVRIRLLTPLVTFLKREIIDPARISYPQAIWGYYADGASEINELDEQGVGMPILAGARIEVKVMNDDPYEIGIEECVIRPADNSDFLSDVDFVEGVSYLCGVRQEGYGLYYEQSLGVGSGFDHSHLTITYQTLPRPGGRSFKIITGMNYDGTNVWGEFESDEEVGECCWLVKDGMYVELMRNGNMLVPVPGPWNRF